MTGWTYDHAAAQHLDHLAFTDRGHTFTTEFESTET